MANGVVANGRDSLSSRRNRIILAGDHSQVLVGILDFAVTGIGEYGDYGEVIHLHHVQELLRGEHLLFIGPATSDAPMQVRVAGKPFGRLRSRS